MRYVDKQIDRPRILEAQEILDKVRHYNVSDKVRSIIRFLYSGCCAFCGCSMEETSFFQIEHFYPKSSKRYSIYSKSIENLHYSCQRCNTLKKAKVHLKIMSPNFYLVKGTWVHTQQNKVDSELLYVGHLLFSNNRPGTIDRAKETIRLFDLNNFNKASERSNRAYLVESRLRTYSLVYNIISAIYELLNSYSPTSNPAIESLFLVVSRSMESTSSFSKMIIQNFGMDVVKLLSIYLKIKR